jgi:hypothetical protein
MEWTNRDLLWARAKLRWLLLRIARDWESSAKRLRASVR